MPRNESTSLRRALSAGAIILAAGLALMPGSAGAQSGPTTYHACYVPGSGTIYRIKEANTPAACKKSTHVEFQWTDFVRALDPVIAQTSVVIQPGQTGTAVATCPSGSVMYTGGYALLTDEDVRVIRNHPNTSPVPNLMNGWAVVAKNASSAPHTVIAYARCTVG